MSTVVERSEMDQAMREIARRYADGTPAEQLAILKAAAAAHTPEGIDDGWATCWHETRGGDVVIHLVPGPRLLELLLPAAALPGYQPSRPPRGDRAG